MAEGWVDRDGTPLQVGQTCLLVDSADGRPLLRLRITGGRLSDQEAQRTVTVADPSGHAVAELLEILPGATRWMWEGVTRFYPPASCLVVEQS